MRFFRWIISSIISFFSNHKKGFTRVAGIGAAGAGGVGIIKACQAKKINEQAIEIQQAALKRHDRAYVETQQVLANLGKVENQVIDSFAHFADTMAQIQGRPEIKANFFTSVKLPNYEPDEIKSLATEVQMAIAGAGGAGVGILAGLAAFGAEALVATPAMVGAGLILCVKGFGLKKKAIKNKWQAKQMEKSVEEIVNFYTELRKATNSFRESVSTIYDRYMDYLQRVEDTLLTKDTWKQFTHKEKKNVENTILLARLLYSMVQTKIVVRQESDDKIETVNSTELVKLQKEATKLLDRLA